jgi:RNA polymerase sigma-70 factor, ECF subfamily
MVLSTGSRQAAESPPQTFTPMSGMLADRCHGQEHPRDLTNVARLHRAALLARAQFLSRAPSDAWDLLQDTFERALRTMPLGLPSDETRRWMLVVMHNIHFDRCRAAKPWAETDCCNEPSWRALDVDQVRACLRRLDPRLRDAYVLQTEERLPLRTIAERLGIPVATVGTRLFRARRRLRELLEVERSPAESEHAQRTPSEDSQ